MRNFTYKNIRSVIRLSCNLSGGLIGSMIGCFLMGVLYEGIKAYREYWMRGAFEEVSYNEVDIGT